MLQNEKILLATMHKKELAIQQPIEKAFGCEVIVTQGYNTDQFGTFCGEKERFLSPREMVLHKAKVAMKAFSFDFAIASEGSFGPHPIIGFTPLSEELLGFVDSKNGIEFVVKMQTTKTNYAYSVFEKNQPMDEFLSRCDFPSHGIIVRELASNHVIAKGIQSLDGLDAAIHKGFKISKQIRLETDMRANYNPTRMQVINELTFVLIDRLKSVCSSCGMYGFGEVQMSGNLPCSYCKSDTELFGNLIESCIRCDYKIIKPRSDCLEYADPTYCNYCNP